PRGARREGTAVPGLEAGAGEGGDGDEAWLEDAVGDAEKRGGVGATREVQRRQHRAEAATAQRELEAPHRRVDGGPHSAVGARLRVVLDPRDDVHWYLLQPFRQPHRALA